MPLLVDLSLGCLLINHKLGPSTLTFLACKIRLLLGFLYFVDGCSITEVLDLAWRDALFLFHTLDCIVHVDVLFDTELLKVLFEL
jgi:hypothetical protein